jgi:hypothetical protein
MAIKGADKNGNTEYVVHQGKFDKTALANNLLPAMKKLNELVSKNDLNFNDVFTLLKGEKIAKNGKVIELDLISKNIISRFKMQFGTLSHAIPVIGHDKVILRVEKILHGMNGLVEVNSHDLRTVMQRDNDGDHLYSHTKLPWNIFKAFMQENGRKDDFEMLNTESVLNRDYINIFGIGSNLVAGERSTDVGFHKYSNTLASGKMNMGKIIGARSVLSWLGRTGITFNNKPLLKNMFKRNEFGSREWGAINSFYNLIQNTVDIHGGIHNLVRAERSLENFVYFGIKDKFLRETIENAKEGELDPVLKKMYDEGTGMLHENIKKEFGNTRLDREMFYAIIRTLKQSNMIQNDTWDEKGSRAPEPNEIRDAYYDMQNFFNNPTLFLSNKVVSRIRLEQLIKPGDSEVNALVNEYIERFHPDYMNVKDKRNLYRDILRGKGPKVLKQQFGFTNLDVADPAGTAFEMSIGGKYMKELVATNAFWDRNYEGLKTPTNDAYNKAGLFVKNIESYVEKARMMGETDIVGLAGDMTIDITSFGGSATTQIKQALNNGILKELLQRQHTNLLGTVEYFRAERFTNPYKLEKLTDRLENLQIAMNLMDIQISKDMVLNKNNVYTATAPKNFRGTWNKKFKNLYDGQRVAVYSIKGDVQITKEAGDKLEYALYEYAQGERKLNYNQLKFEGYYTNRSTPLKMKKGVTYIIDDKPMQRISLSENEMKYSRALFDVTYRNDINPRIFLANSADASEFISDVTVIRAQTNMEHISTIQDAMSNKVLAQPLYAMQSAKEAAHIREFFTKWEGRIGSNFDPVDVIFKYLIQPQASPTLYHSDKAGNIIPGYKANDFLVKTTFNWMENNGYGEYVKKIVYDWERAVKGEYEIDSTVWDRTTSLRYDYSNLGHMANPVRSMAKNMNVWFASPILEFYLEKINDNQKQRIIEAEGSDNTRIGVRTLKSQKQKWSEISNEGQPC